MAKASSILAGDAQWYKDAVIYELHVKTFCDSNGDGIGDFRGLTSKLDYLEDLGVNAIWLLPFYPSPRRDDGYDIADYRTIHSDYGTLRDFKTFVRQAHARNIRVITELVINHTSDQHAWFQRSRRSKPGSKWRNFYVWSETPEKYQDARIIFQDFEFSNWAWDPMVKAYYWHRFYHHQPDLNFDSPLVQQEVLKVMDYWFDMGVDGLRLDAIPYLFEREGTNCENLPETFDFLRRLRSHIDERHQDKMLLAEANQWPEDAVSYFGDGDICHMSFHFPLMPRLFMSVQLENRYPIIDILDQTPAIHDTCQWAMFLRNHDELTLEMVTDEERDYMYRAYARDFRFRINLGIRRRLAPLLANDPAKIRLMNVMLFTLPGSPVLYYGDEIGMGDNAWLGDRDGVRTPMQWNADKNAGFSTANPQKMYLPVIIDPEYHYETVNVETQARNTSSLLWWMRSLITTYKQHKAFSRGTITFLSPDNSKVLAFVRCYGEETMLVALNLSRHAQVAWLRMPEYSGWEVKELFSRNPFPSVQDEPYVLTFAPFGAFVFQLSQLATSEEELAAELPLLASEMTWTDLLQDRSIRRALEERILPGYLTRQRWFGGKARTIQSLRILEWMSVSRAKDSAKVLLVRVSYVEGSPEIYVLPLAKTAHDPDQELPKGALALANIKGGAVVLFEAVHDETFAEDLYELLMRRKKIAATEGTVTASSRKILRQFGGEPPHSRLLGVEQSNTSILYGDKLLLKLYRRTEEGLHPDLEIVRYLTQKAGFQHIPPYAGAIEYRRPGREALVVGLMQEFVPNQGDAWQYSLDALDHYFDRILALDPADGKVAVPGRSVLAVALEEPGESVFERVGGLYLEMTGLLGRRTAELHLALAEGRREPGFVPEPFSMLYQRGVFQSMLNQTRQGFRTLREMSGRLPGHLQEEAGQALKLERTVVGIMRSLLKEKVDAVKIRIHGDYHLGQVLYTGKDFVIFDFEGEPARSLSERRLKRSPVRDVAGMIRSFHYAAYTALHHTAAGREDVLSQLDPWAEHWYLQVSGAFLRGYLDTARGSRIIPKEHSQLERMLSAYLLEKAVYELGYELNNRPEWVGIPLRGIRYLCTAFREEQRS